MTRAEERRAVRQAAVLRDPLAGFGRAIADHPSEPPVGVHPQLHQAYFEGLLNVRDDLRAEPGTAPRMGLPWHGSA